MFRQAIRNFIRLCQANKLFLTLSSLCLVCAFVSFLFLQERGYYMYKVNVEIQQETQLLYFAANDATIIENLYEKLANDPVLPKMGIVTVSDEKNAGVYWDRAWNEEVWYTPYGRFFSTEEMESGAKVALLGMSYIAQLTQGNIDAIWETGIDLIGTQFDAIGNYDDWAANPIQEETYESEILPTSITIPLKTYFNIGLSATRFRGVFAQPLTSAQITHLDDLMQSFGNIRSFSLPKAYNANAVNSYINGIAPYALMIILSLLSIVSVILYWLRKEFARYQIYRICGAKGGQIAFFLSLNVALLVTITYAFACLAVLGLTMITPEGIVSPLPWQFHVVIYIGVLLFTLSAVNIRAIPIVFRENILPK